MIQEAQDSLVVHDNSVGRFLGFPRWPGSIKGFEVSLTYVFDVGLSGCIAAIAGLCMLVCLIALLVARYTCARRLVTRKHPRFAADVAGAKTDAKHNLGFQLAAHAYIVVLAIALTGVRSISSSAGLVLDIYKGLIHELRMLVLSLTDLTASTLDSFEDLDTSVLDGEFVQLSFETLKQYLPPRFPDLLSFRIEFERLVRRVLDIGNDIDHLVDIVHVVLAVVVVLQLTGPLFLYVAGRYGRESATIGVLVSTAFLIWPFLVSWVLLSVSASVGIFLADSCELLHEHRAVLLGADPSKYPENILVDSGVLCPSGSAAASLNEQLDLTVDAVVGNPLAADVASIVFDTKEKDLVETATWIQDYAGSWLNCTRPILLTGQVEQAICGQSGSSGPVGNISASLINGVWLLWLSSLLTALLLSLFFVAQTVGLCGEWPISIVLRSTAGKDEEAPKPKDKDIDQSSMASSETTEQPTESPLGFIPTNGIFPG